MQKWLKWVLVSIGIAGLAILALVAFSRDSRNNKKDFNQKYSFSEKKSFAWPSPTAKTITAAPFDLAQVEIISKFRSCAGHDRSGYNFNQVLETDRAMKHYFYPIPEFQGTMDKIKIFAPFDGKVAWIQRVSPDGMQFQAEYLRKNGAIEKSPVQARNEKKPRLNQGADVGIASSLDENAMMNLNHLQLPHDWQVGDTVKAGELIGYASIYDKGSNFDMDYVGRDKKIENGTEVEVLDSMFDHMTEPVLAEFAKYGITPQNIKFTKEERDAAPCDFDPVTKYNGSCYEGYENECWVKLKR